MDATLPIDPLLKGATDLVSSSLLGTIVVTMAYIIVHLWRDAKAQSKQSDADLDQERARHATEMADLRKKHDIEIAEQRKLNGELQEARLNEIKAALADVVKATGTVEQALAVLHGGAR